MTRRASAKTIDFLNIPNPTYLDARRYLVDLCAHHREALMSDDPMYSAEDDELWAAIGWLNEAFERETGRRA